MVLSEFKKNLQRIKELEIQTKRALQGSLIGNAQSRQKGFGFDFDQLREYQHGDDVRLIDWKSSARGNGLLVRQYFEERNRTIIICLDVSASTRFGSKKELKIDIAKQVAGVLSLASQYAQDKVGLILFADGIEKEILPNKGIHHVHQLLDTMLSYQAKSKGTNFNVLFEHLAYRYNKQALVFVISDFISQQDFESTLKKAVARKEIIAISCVDKQERSLSSVGFLWSQDLETGQVALLDLRKRKQAGINKVLDARIQQQKSMFAKHQVDMLEIVPDCDYIHDLIIFFQKRLMY